MLPEDPDDLDTLIRRLNSGVEASREKVDSARQWEQWIERNGRDLFLVVGCGRAPVVELLHISYGARQHIRKNALQHLHQEIALTRKSGSLSFEESLARLVKANKISRLDGLQRARHPEEFELLVG